MALTHYCSQTINVNEIKLFAYPCIDFTQEKEEEEKERKEQEFVAQRKLEELSKMEGGKEKLVYNQVSSSLSNAQSAGTIP